MINTSTSDENLCGLKRADFQTTVNGKQTDLFILKNENGAEIAVTNYGGAVLAIMVPDKNGKYANVIQGPMLSIATNLSSVLLSVVTETV